MTKHVSQVHNATGPTPGDEKLALRVTQSGACRHRMSIRSEIGVWIVRECGVEYEDRSGSIALLHRLGKGHRNAEAISRKQDPAKPDGLHREL